MQLPDNEKPAPKHSLVESARYVFPRVWAISAKLCLWIAGTAVLAALLAPVSVIILGVLVTRFQQSDIAATNSWTQITPWLLLAGSAAIVTAVASAIQRYCKSRLSDELGLFGRIQVLEAAAELDLKTLEDRRTQNLLERASSVAGTNLLQFSEGLIKVATSCVQVIGLAGVLLWIEPFWSIALLLLGAPAVMASSYLSSMKHEIRRNKTTSRRWSRYYGRHFTQRNCVASTKLLRLEPLLLGRHRDVMREILQANQRFYRLSAVIDALSTVLTVAVLLTAAFAVGRQVMAGTVSVGEFVAFWMAAWRLKTAMGNASSACSRVWEAHLSIGESREFLELPTDVKNSGRLKPTRIRGHVELRNVTFTYPKASRPTIQDVSLTIHEGETVAIVGHNGAGKTTLAKLLARLYQADQGQILVDGQLIEDYDFSSLYQQFSFVFQQAARYEATAGENIAFGDWQRLLDQPDEIARIAQAARIDQMIEGLPDGYDSLLGRMFGDSDLSGGQWQKLSIARALACDPALVILDEPAANLDVHSEHAMYQTVHDLIRDRTTILISHRFSTVGMADRIFVLDEGRLVEQGTHQQLLEIGGTYAAMCRTHQATVSIRNRTIPNDLAMNNMEGVCEYKSA